MSLCGCKTRVSKQHSAYAWIATCILFLINLTFHNLSLHSSYKIHQPFTDYFLRLPYSELLEKRLFRARANRPVVSAKHFVVRKLYVLEFFHEGAPNQQADLDSIHWIEDSHSLAWVGHRHCFWIRCLQSRFSMFSCRLIPFHFHSLWDA